MRYTLSLGFEEHSETMFKLLNDQAIQSLCLRDTLSPTFTNRLISMRLS
jgi:hypothetical protein